MESKGNQTCGRCLERCWTTIMSMFNTQLICDRCKEAETKSPRYEAACRAEEAALRAGNANFRGIGL